MSYKLYSTALGRIVDSSGKGDFTTIQAAITAASSGQTVFVRPGLTGIYTENLTLKAGVNLVAYDGDQSTPNVTISGTCTFTGAGTITISNIRLQTNGATAAIAVTGSSASILNLNSCYLNFTANTGITYSSSSSSSAININFCIGDLTTTGIAYFSHSSAGVLSLRRTSLFNSGNSTTASTCSAGTLSIVNSSILGAISMSSTGVILSNFTNFNCTVINTTALTHDGGSSTVENCSFAGGSASAISISSGKTLTISQCNITSSNTNAITGAGTINYNGLAFNGSSKTINVTTQTTAGTMFGSTTTAPTAGMVGEEQTSSVTAVATTSGATKSITSIVLTPGVWEVSCLASAVATGGTALMQAFIAGISTTNNAFSGTGGQDHLQLSISSGVLGISVPRVRAVITTTMGNTTYYLSVQTTYTSTTCPVNGRISATRVG